MVEDRKESMKAMMKEEGDWKKDPKRPSKSEKTASNRKNKT